MGLLDGVYAGWDRLVHRPIFPGGNLLGDVLYGTSPHLWFMPAMWAVLVVVNQVKGRVSAQGMVVGSGLAVMALLAATPFTRPFTPLLTPPLGQWLHAAPPMLLGIMIGLAGRVPRPIVAAMATGVALTCVPLVLTPLVGVTVPYLVGAIAVLAAIGAGRWMPLTSLDIRPVSACMLGVYLTHIIGLGVAERLV